MSINKHNLAYIIGVALGDGNLSNPNGRAVRLRITCDLKYPKLIQKMCRAIKRLLPNNKVSIISKPTFCNISCYSNKWENLLGWQALEGPKHKQKVSIPKWVMDDVQYAIPCLRGLLETDGSIYIDRGYKMANFVTIIRPLADNVMDIIARLGFKANIYTINTTPKTRYTIRVSKNIEEFIKVVGFNKA